ncbi:MAG: BolA/IbaG family iron-sulfur metabolism protein [Burkholderia sp.]|nr:BolA/IbaG family iron-sulfur metabolism protein [Burkholderia sp.]
MKPISDQIKRHILDKIVCCYLELKGDGQHFFLTIVSSEFEGKKLIYRHQIVYKALDELMKEEIHAISMKTLTPKEWKEIMEPHR